MNLTINAFSGENFQSKKEYLYGLNKAAKNVHSYSLAMQPRLQRLGENHEAPIYIASAKAYLDMLTQDNRFWNYAHMFNKKDLQGIKILMEPMEQIGVKPLEDFAKILKEVMAQNGTKNDCRERAAQELLNKLA